MPADQQKETPADLKITQRIRQKVMKNKSLSSYAHKVKIITRDVSVTLKDPVRSQKAKSFIEKAAGTSELAVEPEKKP